MRQVRIMAEIIEDGVVVESRSLLWGADKDTDEDCVVAEAAGEIISYFEMYHEPGDAILYMVSRTRTESAILKELGSAYRQWTCNSNFEDCVKLVVDEEKLTAE